MSGCYNYGHSTLYTPIYILSNQNAETEQRIHLQEYAVKIAILFHIVQYVINHDRTDAKPTIRKQTAQCHNVQTPLIFGCVQSTTNGPNDNVIVVC